jgi:hypothetical protein
MKKKKVTMDIKEAYKQMAVLTEPICRTECRAPMTCCSSEYCETALEYAQERWGETLVRTSHPTLPLMGTDPEGRATGCIAPPHTRPMCTAHLCSINGLGFIPDPAKDKLYWELRELIGLMELEEYKDEK